MELDNLIIELNKLREEHGNLEVVTTDYEMGTQDIEPDVRVADFNLRVDGYVLINKNEKYISL